jgi:hypothetical protein
LHVIGDSYGPLLWYLVLDILGAAQDLAHTRVLDRADDLLVARPDHLVSEVFTHAHPPMPMPLTLPLSVAPAFLPFLWRRGFTFLRERRRSLTFLVDLRLLISSSFR